MKWMTDWNLDLKSHWKWYRGKLQYILCFFRKGGLISESFSFWLISPKRGAESLSWASFFSWIVLRIVIWHPFWEIWAKVKNFLRLSYLYVKTISTNFAKYIDFKNQYILQLHVFHKSCWLCNFFFIKGSASWFDELSNLK